MYVLSAHAHDVRLALYVQVKIVESICPLRDIILQMQGAHGVCALILNIGSFEVTGIGTLSLRSLLGTSNREVARPQESVAVTCSVNGTVLEWAQPDGNTIGTFASSSSVGDGFSELVNQSGRVTCRASGVLEAII